jgi:hypothetical protein
MKRPLCVPLVWGLFLWCSLLTLPAAAQSPVRLRFEPKVTRLAVGETARVQLIAEQIPEPGLACFQVTLRYTASIIQVVNPNEAYRTANIPPFSPLGNHPFCSVVRQSPHCPDPAWALTTTKRVPIGADQMKKGAVTIAYGTQGTEALPTAPGVLALVDVVGQKRGQTALTVDDFILCDSSEPPRFVKRVRVQGGTVTVRAGK